MGRKRDEYYLNINWADLAKEEGYYDYVEKRKQEQAQKEEAQKRKVQEWLRKKEERKQREKAKLERARANKPAQIQQKRLEHLRFENESKTMFYRTIEYRQIPEHPNYYISQVGKVRNLNGKLLNNKVTSSDSKIRLRTEGLRDVAIYRHILLHAAWPELSLIDCGTHMEYDGEVFKVIPSFPDYLLSVTGRVLRLKNFTYPKLDKYGRYLLSRDGKQYGKAVNLLYLETYGPGHPKIWDKRKGVRPPE